MTIIDKMNSADLRNELNFDFEKGTRPTSITAKFVKALTSSIKNLCGHEPIARDRLGLYLSTGMRFRCS